APSLVTIMTAAGGKALPMAWPPERSLARSWGRLVRTIISPARIARTGTNVIVAGVRMHIGTSAWDTTVRIQRVGTIWGIGACMITARRGRGTSDTMIVILGAPGPDVTHVSIATTTITIVIRPMRHVASSGAVWLARSSATIMDVVAGRAPDTVPPAATSSGAWRTRGLGSGRRRQRRLKPGRALRCVRRRVQHG